MNGRFQIAIHIMTLLSLSEGECLSSDYIAGSININPVLVRKELSNLRQHGLVTSKEGNSGGYSIAKSAQLISMADIYQTVKQNTLLGQARNQPNPKCPVGKQINQHLNSLYTDVDTAVLHKLSQQTLADFNQQFH
ncbi:Rrf2 family transcriptional regulator [Mucilaginibacter robiniae]|uniref:Rrf2 family transcriptional regulator n=1 Tax=Mucilaginibacter robiniae TaxID=2728022 RepID=A0A7L5E3L5_9SPHI|nr:Rrf2 family transcriptional regulator [Mucilaginibacter robiniae]QJD97621.1 Rrf2 family transcriptional regulator [Mucilaginibacter robiniae]